MEGRSISSPFFFYKQWQGLKLDCNQELKQNAESFGNGIREETKRRKERNKKIETKKNDPSLEREKDKKMVFLLSK